MPGTSPNPAQQGFPLIDLAAGAQHAGHGLKASHGLRTGRSDDRIGSPGFHQGDQRDIADPWNAGASIRCPSAAPGDRSPQQDLRVIVPVSAGPASIAAPMVSRLKGSSGRAVRDTSTGRHRPMHVLDLAGRIGFQYILSPLFGPLK